MSKYPRELHDFEIDGRKFRIMSGEYGEFLQCLSADKEGWYIVEENFPTTTDPQEIIAELANIAAYYIRENEKLEEVRE